MTSASPITDASGTVLGVDVGGTSIKAAVVNCDSGTLTTPVHVLPTPSPARPDALLDTIRCAAAHFHWEGPLGCGFPAVVKNGVTLTAANVDKGWIGFPLHDRLHALTGHPVAVLNDADAAALAEMRFGTGRDLGCDRQGVTLLITLGTGIGTALFVNGQLIPNTELGHIEIDGVDAERRAATVVREREGLSWAEWGERVNTYLQRIEFLLSPDVIIIGGGVSASPEKFFPHIHVSARLVTARMGNDAGIVGAALAFRRKAAAAAPGPSQSA